MVVAQSGPSRKGEVISKDEILGGVQGKPTAIFVKKRRVQLNVKTTIESGVSQLICSKPNSSLPAFATGVVQYDLLARRSVPYSYVYAFIEAVGRAGLPRRERRRHR